jgi:hypothetical protein
MEMDQDLLIKCVTEYAVHTLVHCLVLYTNVKTKDNFINS